MLPIANYNPTVCRSPQQVRVALGDRLSRLSGKALQETFVLFEKGVANWFRDGPVVLRIGSERLELCAFKLDELFVSWGNLDLSAPVDWAGIPLVWKRNAVPSIDSCLRQPLAGAVAVEYLFETTRLAKRGRPEDSDKKSATWLLHALELSFGGHYVTVWNALDENGVSGERLLGAGFRRTILF